MVTCSDDILKKRVVQRLGRAGIRRFRPRGGHQYSPFRGSDYMIPYMVGKLAPISTHFTRGLVKYIPGRGYFRAVSSQNRDNFVTFPPPQIIERLKKKKKIAVVSASSKCHGTAIFGTAGRREDTDVFCFVLVLFLFFFLHGRFEQGLK